MTASIDHASAARTLMRRADKRMEGVLTDTISDAAELDLKAAHVHAMLAVAEQQRITNGLQLALVDQLTAIAPYLTPVGAQIDPSIRIRDYLDEEQWESIGQGVRS